MKLANMVEKISGSVTEGYQKIEDGVVGGFNKVSDMFVEKLVIPGVVIGIMGMIPVAMAYPTYRRILRSERQRIAPEILRLSEELMK